MKISILSLIVGLIIGVLLIGFLYYAAYKAFEVYFKIRHPFKKSSSENSEATNISTPPNKMYISEWMSTQSDPYFNGNFIAEGDVYLFGNNGKSIAIDNTRKFLKLVDFNSTDKLQKWKLFFYKNPNDPYEETEGIIYNAATNKYISFNADGIILKDLEEPYLLSQPHSSFNIECIHDANKISNKHGNMWITSSGEVLTTTANKKNAMDFFVAII